VAYFNQNKSSFGNWITDSDATEYIPARIIVEYLEYDWAHPPFNIKTGRWVSNEHALKFTISECLQDIGQSLLLCIVFRPARSRAGSILEFLILIGLLDWLG